MKVCASTGGMLGSCSRRSLPVNQEGLDKACDCEYEEEKSGQVYGGALLEHGFQFVGSTFNKKNRIFQQRKCVRCAR